jgi:hypothetical protein
VISRCLSCIPLVLVIVATAGCDITGEYERRFQETLTGAGQRAAFDAVLFATETEITGEGNTASGVKIRLPSVFNSESKSLAATEPRAQPPFVKLPGFGYALERSLPDGSNQLAPAYVYFAAVPKGDQKPDQVQGPIAATIAGAFPGATWADAQFTTPDGATVTHKVIRGDGQQDFDLSGTGGAVQRLDGRFALYFIESPTHYALVGFRAPKAQGDAANFEAAINAAMGTVVAAPGAAAAPASAPPAGGTPPAGSTPPAGGPAAS